MRVQFWVANVVTACGGNVVSSCGRKVVRKRCPTNASKHVATRHGQEKVTNRVKIKCHYRNNVGTQCCAMKTWNMFSLVA